MVKVSVIVPVYNLEKYIGECLLSLVKQSFKDFEVIVVNDGSTDKSQIVIDDYVKKYKFIKSIVKENGGVALARNLGVEQAIGEYIMFVDGDDYIDSEMINKLYNEAINKELDIVCCDINKFYSNGKLEYYKCINEYSDDIVKNYIIGDLGPCNKLFKKSVFKNITFRNISYEDLDVLPLLVLYTKKISYINEPLYYYRQVDGSATRLTKFKPKMLDIFEVLNNLYKKLYNMYPLEIEYLYITHLLRTSTLRFIALDNTMKYLDEIVNIMNERFPNYKNNIYFRKSSKKLKLICNLAMKKRRNIIKLIQKVTNK